MHWFLFAALALAAAVYLWWRQAAVGRDAPPPSKPPEEGEAFRQWLEQPGVLEALAQTVEALRALMAHPELGGPGFLTVRLPQPEEAGGSVVITAQYPNIREALYRRIIRGELTREALREAGAPEALLRLSPHFETDSGGVVSVSLPTACMGPELAGRLSGRRERQAALGLLAGRLGERFPDVEARPFGTELLLE